MRSPLFGLLLSCYCLLACGQILTPAAGGTDFAIQGEYIGSNTTTGAPMGAQVMAQGQGNFRLLLLDGGLPGQGWDGQGRIFISGAIQGASANFIQGATNLSVNLTGDSLRGINAQGQTLSLTKILRQSPTLGQAAPPAAVTLFDGTSVSSWTDAILDSNGYLRPGGVFGSGGAVTSQAYGNFTLHLEFCTPFEPLDAGQQRGNSGIYIQNRYELQILDSFGQSYLDLGADTLEPKRHCGAFWEMVSPALNMTFPPLSWQTYDIDFMTATFNGTVKTANARVTVRLNGTLIHDTRDLINYTLGGNAVTASPGPHRFQNHGDVVRFRNIWIVDGPTAIAARPLPRRGSKLSVQSELRYSLVDSRLARPRDPQGRLLILHHPQ